jgi:hypothetical protein
MGIGSMNPGGDDTCAESGLWGNVGGGNFRHKELKV